MKVCNEIIEKSKDESFLTEQQIKVLKLKSKGYSQAEIAKLLGTTRANICTLEKRAMKNLIKAMNTIKIFENLFPIEISIEKGEDLFDIPKKIFKVADKHGIKIDETTTTLIERIRTLASKRINGRVVEKDFKIRLTRFGSIKISE